RVVNDGEVPVFQDEFKLGQFLFRIHILKPDKPIAQRDFASPPLSLAFDVDDRRALAHVLPPRNNSICNRFRLGIRSTVPGSNSRGISMSLYSAMTHQCRESPKYRHAKMSIRSFSDTVWNTSSELRVLSIPSSISMYSTP